MRPPKGYKSGENPLLHRLYCASGLSMALNTMNTVQIPLVMHSNEMDKVAGLVVVNPKNTSFEEDGGPLCREGSIIDRMRISLKFQMTKLCDKAALTSGTAGPNFDDGVYTGDSVNSFNFLWRPVFNVYPEKLDAADDDTGTTVAAILGLTKDATFEDIVPITTNKLPTAGPSETALPVSTVNAVQVFGDFNMTTNLNMEDHTYNEDLLHTALRRYTNKGALRSCLGRTRHVTLSRARPFKNFYIDKRVPNAIRRIQKYGYFAIQIHLPMAGDPGQHIATSTLTSAAHLGFSVLANYHEWHEDFRQEAVGDGT